LAGFVLLVRLNQAMAGLVVKGGNKKRLDRPAARNIKNATLIKK
jgi:hypothetical protein